MSRRAPAHDEFEDPSRDAAAERCMRGPEGCQGRVCGRASFGGTGLMIYECAAHRDQAWERELELRRRYPVLPPSDWDPMDAGERWDPDD